MTPRERLLAIHQALWWHPVRVGMEPTKEMLDLWVELRMTHTDATYSDLMNAKSDFDKWREKLECRDITP